jgi:hypothetical protein
MSNSSFIGQMIGIDTNGGSVPVVVDSSGAFRIVDKTQNSTFLSLAAQTTTVNSSAVDVTGFQEMTAFINVTAASGTSPTLDVKFQVQDPVSLAWFDVASGAFTQKTAVSSEMKLITAGIGTTVRCVATIGGTTPSFSFTVSATFK